MSTLMSSDDLERKVAAQRALGELAGMAECRRSIGSDDASRARLLACPLFLTSAREALLLIQAHHCLDHRSDKEIIKTSLGLTMGQRE